MSKIVSIHQPNYLPWIPYFNKILTSDVFILLDNVQYTNNDWRNRNKIKIGDEAKYLTIPLGRKQIKKKINEVLLPVDDMWKNKSLKKIKTSYHNSSQLFNHLDFLTDFYQCDRIYLDKFLIKFIYYILDICGSNTKIIKSSEIAIDPNLKSTKRLIELIKAVDGDAYLSGVDGRNYMDVSQFEKNQISLEFQEFKFKSYSQLGSNFIPGLSVIDLIMNVDNENVKSKIVQN